MPKGGVVSAITNVISTILNPILKLFMPNTSSSASLKNSRSASSNNALQGRTNASRPGERIADIRGFVRAYPDLLMDYRIFKDRTEYEVQFLCLGVGEYQIEDVRDGITPSSNISGEQLNFYKSGSAPGSGSPYMNIGGGININQFPIMVAKASNEADGSEVKPPNYADISKATFKIYSTGEIDTIPSESGTTIDWSERAPVASTVRITQFYSFTPRATPAGTYNRNDLSGTYTVLSSGENILILDTTGHPGWSSLSATGQAAYLQAFQRTDGYWEFTNSGGSTQFNFSPSVDSSTPYVVGPYLLDSADKVMINLYAQNGVYKTDGDIYPFTVSFQVILSDPTGVSANVTHNMNVTGRFTEAVGSTLIVNNPYSGPVNVSVRRTSNTDKDFEGSVVDNIKWRDLYAVSNISPRSYGNVTLIHAVTKATNAALKQKERKLNMLATRIVNGVASRNFADVVMSIHTDPYFGRRTTATIDVEALYDVQQQILDYFGDPRSIQVGYTFDNNSTTYEEALQTVCNTVNVTPYQVGSVLYFFPEIPQDVSSMQFGHTFKVPDTDKRTRTFSPLKDYTGVQVKYYDHDEESYLYVTTGEETNVNKVDLDACQSRYLAQIRADREYNKLKYQRITHECTALSIGLQAAPGMRVDMVDNTRMKQMDGIVVDVDGLTLYLSDPVQLIEGYSYTASFTGRLGTLENIGVTAGDDEFTVRLLNSPSEEIYTGWLRDKTSYVIRADDERTKLAMLVQSTEPSGRDNNYQVNLTCINYDARYYKDD
ncbi:MAG: putative tail tip protein [Siphoviridae sp. ctdc_1]|nr:MAG: putative tail tip protein [Siphoviridae sp. ctdc_1]